MSDAMMEIIKTTYGPDNGGRDEPHPSQHCDRCGFVRDYLLHYPYHAEDGKARTYRICLRCIRRLVELGKAVGVILNQR